MKISKRRDWLITTVATLFILNVLVLPVCIRYAYAGSANAPDRTLTYTDGTLTWDSATSIRPDGTAEVDFFSNAYSNVLSESDDHVVAPGTSRVTTIRLVNEVSRPVSYKALVYQLKQDERLPLESFMESEGASETVNHPALPNGVAESDIIKVVEGTLDGHQTQDFQVGWNWDFEGSELQDAIDTELGNDASAEATLGFYVVVSDEGPEEITPDIPKTGDEVPVVTYLALGFISIAILLLLFFKRDHSKEENA